jgi:GT2 family glycosyltransferase
MVDNASDDGSSEYVQKHFPWVKIIQNKENSGYAGGNNVGAEHATGSYIVILNNDAEVDSRWLEEMISVIKSDPSIGICGCKLLDSNKRTTISSVGSACDIYGFPYPISANIVNRPEFNLVIDVFLVAGAGFTIRSSLWNKLEGFDPKYFVYMEELDLCWRAQLAGYRVVVNPLSTLYHPAIGATTGKLAYAKKRYFMERNTQRTLLKNYNITTIFTILPRYFALMLAESIFFLLIQRNIHLVLADLRGVFWNMRNFRDTWNLHEKVQKSREINDKNVQSKMIHGSAKIRAGFEGLTGFKTVTKNGKTSCI